MAELQEVQTRSTRLEQEHLEALRLAEQRLSALQVEKVEDAARLDAALAARSEIEDRLSRQQEKEAESVRLALEQCAALQLEREEEHARLEAAEKEAANQVLRLEAGHAAVVTRIQAGVDRLTKDARAADEKRREEALGFAKRLSDLEKEKAKALEESGALQRRLRATDAGHRDALRLVEERSASERREQVEKLAKAAASLVDAQARLDLATKAATHETERLEAERAVEVNRLQADLTQIRDQAAAAEARHANDTARTSEHIAVLERAAFSAPPTSDAFPEEVEDAPPIAEVPEDRRVRGTPLNSSPRLPPESANWEYERILRGGTKKKTKMQVLLREVARRIRGSDAEAKG